MMKIACPQCNTVGSMSLLKPHYHGPYRCWKCRAIFTITIENDEVISFEPLTEDELKKQQEIQAIQEKMKRWQQ